MHLKSIRGVGLNFDRGAELSTRRYCPACDHNHSLADTGSRAFVRRFKWDCLSERPQTNPVRALRAPRSNFGLTLRKW